MNIYLITLSVACLLAYQAERQGWTDENEKLHFDKKYVVILIIFLCVISGFRYMNYYQSDEYNYRVMVKGLKGESLLKTIDFTDEWISQLIYWVSANVFNTDQFLILFAAVITNVSFIIFFSRHAKSLWMVTFMYIAGGAYFTSMNVLRQYMAAAIVVWCYEMAKNKKLCFYIILVVIASGIHQSALLMLPMYFVLRKKKIDQAAVIIIIATLILFYNFQAIIESVLSSGTSYDHYLEEMMSSGYGVKLLRILAWLIPYLLIIARYRFCEDVMRLQPIIWFAVLMSACINIVSYQYVFFARIDAYFAIPALCGVIRVPEMFEERSRRIVETAMIVLFFAFGCYQMSGFSTYHNILFENISGVLYY